MKEELENITDDTCMNKIRAMREAYVPHEMEKCKVCLYYHSAYICYMYKPFKERDGRKEE